MAKTHNFAFSALVLAHFLFLNMAALADDFPLRKTYPGIATIETADLFERRSDVTIIDVRSQYEYETLRIKDALNVPVNDRGFQQHIFEIMSTKEKAIVFYCNGRTCQKSFDAAVKALKSGVKNVSVYDAGVLEWAKTHPEHTALLGRSPVKSANLIDDSRFSERLLKPSAFAAKAKAGAMVLDVRDLVQRDNPLFPMKEERAPLDDKATLDAVIARAKKAKKTLLVYDAVGKQVQWFQYYLEDKQVKDYYFLKGGAEAYFKATLGKK